MHCQIHPRLAASVRILVIIFFPCPTWFIPGLFPPPDLPETAPQSPIRSRISVPLVHRVRDRVLTRSEVDCHPLDVRVLATSAAYTSLYWLRIWAVPSCVLVRKPKKWNQKPWGLVIRLLLLLLYGIFGLHTYVQALSMWRFIQYLYLHRCTWPFNFLSLFLPPQAQSTALDIMRYLRLADADWAEEGEEFQGDSDEFPVCTYLFCSYILVYLYDSYCGWSSTIYTCNDAIVHRSTITYLGLYIIYICIWTLNCHTKYKGSGLGSR